MPLAALLARCWHVAGTSLTMPLAALLAAHTL